MLQKLEDVERRYVELESKLGDPQVIGNRKEYARLGKERADIEELVACYREWKRLSDEIDQHRALLDEDDAELRELAKAELPAMRERLDELQEQLRVLLLPKDPNDEKNVLLEIRAGPGGEEAGLFVANLFRMYSRFAETHGWRVELMSANATGLGGYKEVIALIEGRGTYSQLKYEGGVHRVQRVPVTEASGRIHTSTATVAVLPEADEVDVQLDEAKDLRVDVYRSSGPGGQSVNTTDSAVRVTHLPTGLVVACQDEKSQHKNKAKAIKILRARLLERAQQEQAAKEAASRKSMVGTGERSERIRTYNFPQGRVTDHRINMTLHQIDRIMDGELQPLINALITHYQAEALKAESA
ncbi:MAG TPA: peptide chain release factor 1 [Candidatus Binatia bacterium]|nr:peptide chain release factor 1 [Candidatus Binatia bacterium]